MKLINRLLFILCGLVWTLQPAQAQHMAAKYDQQTLLKNWALSVCLAQVAKDARTADDAGLTASAYLEYGKQEMEAYDEIRKLVHQFKNLQYDGSVKGEYNTMKCIDLFHSKELARLTARLVKKG